jgi:hypothetical protein
MKLFVFCVPILLLIADPTWQTKQIVDWNEDDGRQALTDSPWAKTVTPKITKAANSDSARGNGGMGQMGGLGPGGVGIGMPGIGGHGQAGRNALDVNRYQRGRQHKCKHAAQFDRSLGERTSAAGG